MTFIKHCSTSTPVPSILADTYWAGTLLPEIVMILFTQSTAVLHKYLNDELKLLCSLQFFPEFSQTSPSFPCSEKSLRIPGFTGLWTPCVKTKKHCCKVSDLQLLQPAQAAPATDRALLHTTPAHCAQSPTDNCQPSDNISTTVIHDSMSVTHRD